MADISDVENTIVSLVSSIVYPNGLSNPSIVGVIVDINRGWPIPNDLDRVLKSGNCQVTVWSEAGSNRNTTRYLGVPAYVSQSDVTIQTSVAGQMVALRGTPSPAHLVGVRLGDKTYAYRVTATDTLNSIAAVLAGAIPGATAAGSTITLPAGSPVVARAVIDGAVVNEQRRQEQRMLIRLWCPNASLRDALGKAIDTALSAIERVPMDGDVPIRLRGAGTKSTDNSENASLFLRDLIYTAEYATTTKQSVSAMLFGLIDVNEANETII